jgi:hypothetical protein
MRESRLPYGIRLLMAVVEELYTFVVDSVSKKTLEENTSSRALGTLLELPSHKAEDEDVIYAGPATFKSTAEVLHESRRPEKNTVMYTGSENVPLFKQPTIEFDGIMDRIPYGAMVMVLEGRGRWSEVAYGNTTGWVLRDELIDRAAHVYPDFTIGEANLSDDPNTLKVRACIEDEFGGGVAEVPLQASEYVLYRLYRKGKRIKWPEERPRIAGKWHDLLRGTENVHVSIQPQEGSVMEYTKNDGEGHLAYVEAVFPDQTISISEANFPENGIYNERVLTKEEWRELHPVFVEIS